MKPYYILLTFFFLIVPLRAQNRIPSDETLKNRHIHSYLDAVGNHAVIYTGKEEIKYPTYILNHPYLDTNAFREGTVSFDGVLYPNVKLRLNLHTDELTVSSLDNRFSIVLPDDRVDYAMIDSLYIIYSEPPFTDRPFPKGYHVRIYKGKYEVWKRETMFLESRIKDRIVEMFFVNKRKTYIYKDGIYHTVNSGNSVLKLFDASKRKEVKKFIREQKLSFKKSPDEAIVAVVKFYENLPR